MQLLLRGIAQALAALSPSRDLRQAVRRGRSTASASAASFELALACHFRVAVRRDATRVGLPEVKVGLFPGAGGTQRVARLMQTGDALQMLFKGEQHPPA